MNANVENNNNKQEGLDNAFLAKSNYIFPLFTFYLHVPKEEI